MSIITLALCLGHWAAITCFDRRLTGVIRENQDQKVSLYADNLLLYISDPANSLSHVLYILDQFHNLSGYKLNLQKSELFPINEAARQSSFSSLPFKVSNKFTYLDVNVVDKFFNLFSANFLPLLKQTELSLKHLGLLQAVFIQFEWTFFPNLCIFVSAYPYWSPIPSFIN